jgi:mRNA interferase RelE/StbE
MGWARQRKPNQKCGLTKISQRAIFLYMRAIVFEPPARRQWMKLPPPLRERILIKLETFARTGHGDVKRLKGQDGARLRVGDYRVIFYQEFDEIVVIAVGHRREIYD